MRCEHYFRDVFKCLCTMALTFGNHGHFSFAMVDYMAVHIELKAQAILRDIFVIEALLWDPDQ